MLLHWMQTRWRTELETGFSLGEPLGTEGLPLGQGTDHRESRATLARMKYLGTFQVRARASHQQIGECFSRGKDLYAWSAKGQTARNRN